MDLIKKYVKKRKGQYFVSVTLAIFSVVANLFSYIYMAKIIVNLINGVSNMSLYTILCINILITFVIKEVAAGISTSISHTATFNSLGEIIIYLYVYLRLALNFIITNSICSGNGYHDVCYECSL